MGQKYYVTAVLSGKCRIAQEQKSCKTFIGFLVTLIKFKCKYPIVDARVRDGYRDCSSCNLDNARPMCYHDERRDSYSC